MLITSAVVALLGLTSAAVAEPVDRWHKILAQRAAAASGVQAIQASITEIGVKLAAANNSVLAFKSGGLDGITGLINVNDAVVALGDSITSTTNLAKNTTTLSPTDSTTVGIAFLFLQPNINLLLNNLVSKEPQLDKAAFGLLDTRSLIRDSVVNQQAGAKSLGSALIGILDPSLVGIATPINDQIQGNFTATVSKLQGRSGAIKIPSGLVPTVTDLLAKIGPAINGLLGVSKTRRQEPEYCCGITQAYLDSLAPDQDDYTKVPEPVLVVLKTSGVLPEQ